jgi:hypothetical protein
MSYRVIYYDIIRHHMAQTPLSTNQIVLLNFHTSSNHSFPIALHFCPFPFFFFFVTSFLSFLFYQQYRLPEQAAVPSLLPRCPHVPTATQRWAALHLFSLPLLPSYPPSRLPTCLPSYLHACMHTFIHNFSRSVNCKQVCLCDHPTSPYRLSSFLPSPLSLLYVLYILYCHYRLLSRTET